MARQRLNPINVVGQASPAVADLTANMSNRLLASMQEAGATQRQAMAGGSQQVMAGMQERGAMERAKLGEAGETQRAQIAAGVARSGQQAQVQMSREQIESSDAQNATQIRAATEARQFQGAQQEAMIRLADELDWAKMRYRDAIAREDKAAIDEYNQQVLELQQDTAMMNFGMQMMNYQSTLRMIQKMYGREEADARIADAQAKMADEARMAQKVSKGSLEGLMEKAKELGANPSLGIDQVTTALMGEQGFHVSRDTVTDKAKLAEFLDQNGLEGYLAYHNAVAAAKGQRKGRAEEIQAGKIKESAPGIPLVGFGATVPTKRMVTAQPGGELGRATDADLKTLRQMELNISDLYADKTPLTDGKGTRGRQYLTWEAYRQGDTMSGVALDQINRGLTPEQSRAESLDFYMNRAPDLNPITQYLYWLGATPQAVERFRERMGGMDRLLSPGPSGMISAGLAPARR